MNARRGVVLAIFLASVLWSCTDLPSDPNTPFSIAFSRTPSPSVVLGDTMRDSTGQRAPLRATAFNLRGDTIRDAAITYFLVARDSQPATLDGAYVVAKPDTAYIGDTLRVVAVAGGVQSTPLRVIVTVRPDQIIRVGSDTVRLVLPPTTDTLPLSGPLSVQLRHTRAASEPARDTVVPAYEVRFRIDSTSSHVSVSDTSYLTISDDNRRHSPVDTTDALGMAARRVRVRRVNFPYPYEAIPPGSSAVDTVYVSAFSAYKGSQVIGSPVRFRVLVTLSKPPTS